MLLYTLLHLSFTATRTTAAAREIVFPPIDPIDRNRGAYEHDHDYSQTSIRSQDPHLLSNIYDGFDSPDSKFAGLTTFANSPWVHCLASPASSSSSSTPSSKTASDIEPYDIAFLGAPFDTGTSARPGARFGPVGIRLGSRRISPTFNYSPYTHNNPWKSWARVVDCGDAPLTFFDNTVALKQLLHAHRLISARRANDTTRSHVPRIITLGGDHTTTLAALRSTISHWGPVSVIHFDSHIDTWDPAVLGGGLSHYAGVNHGTFLHIAHEEGLLLNSSNIHAGIRAPASNKHHDWRNDARCGFEIVTARDIDHIGIAGVVERVKRRVGDTSVYISVDIDVLDPAYAPGTGTAEVGGWTTRELLSILDGLVGVKVIGADVVEVAPAYDNAGETTVLAAAEVAQSLMRLMVETPVKSLKDLEAELE